MLDCLRHDVPCFLIGWLTLSPYGYTEQYARFGVGEVLGGVNEIGEIPERIAKFNSQKAERQLGTRVIDRETLRHILGRKEAHILTSRVS